MPKNHKKPFFTFSLITTEQHILKSFPGPQSTRLCLTDARNLEPFCIFGVLSAKSTKNCKTGQKSSKSEIFASWSRQKTPQQRWNWQFSTQINVFLPTIPWKICLLWNIGSLISQNNEIRQNSPKIAQKCSFRHLESQGITTPTLE